MVRRAFLVLSVTVGAAPISSFLFGVKPLDPATFSSVAILLALTAACASVVPALRAARGRRPMRARMLEAPRRGTIRVNSVAGSCGEPATLLRRRRAPPAAEHVA